MVDPPQWEVFFSDFTGGCEVRLLELSQVKIHQIASRVTREITSRPVRSHGDAVKDASKWEIELMRRILPRVPVVFHTILP